MFDGRPVAERSLFWEHEGNSAMREGKRKLASRLSDSWELYDMDLDRTEMHNLADQHPDRVREMIASYAAWVTRVGVQPWPMPETPRGSVRDGGLPTPEYLTKDHLSCRYSNRLGGCRA